jgi:hypothetical protein
MKLQHYPLAFCAKMLNMFNHHKTNSQRNVLQGVILLIAVGNLITLDYLYLQGIKMMPKQWINIIKSK